jgi:hypothetical protein
VNRLSACPECLSVNGHETLCPFNDDADDDNTEYDYGNDIDHAYAQWRDSKDNRP